MGLETAKFYRVRNSLFNKKFNFFNKVKQIIENFGCKVVERFIIDYENYKRDNVNMNISKFIPKFSYITNE